MDRKLLKNMNVYLCHNFDGVNRFGIYHWIGILFIFSLSFCVAWLLNCSFEEVDRICTEILSIFIGLFITSLVFSIEYLKLSRDMFDSVYDVDVEENNNLKKLSVSIIERINQTSQEKLIIKKGDFYTIRIQYTLAFNIIMSVITLSLILIDIILGYNLNNEWHYKDLLFIQPTFKCIIKGVVYLGLRTIILFNVSLVMINTISIVKSILLYSQAKSDFESKES